MKTLKTSLVLLSTVFALVACGQNNSLQTSQAAQPTTTAPTTQANNKQSDFKSSDNKQSNANSNAQNSNTLQKTVKQHTRLKIKVDQRHSNTSSRMTSSIIKLGFILMTLKD